MIAAIGRRYRLSRTRPQDVVPEGRVVLRPRDGIWATIEAASGAA